MIAELAAIAVLAVLLVIGLLVLRRIRILQRYNDLQDIIAILGIDELSEEDRLTVGRARRIERFLGQNMYAAEQFTGEEGSFVDVKDTVEAFDKICKGEYDSAPEQAFAMVGDLDDVEANIKKYS